MIIKPYLTQRTAGWEKLQKQVPCPEALSINHQAPCSSCQPYRDPPIPESLTQILNWNTTQLTCSST